MPEGTVQGTAKVTSSSLNVREGAGKDTKYLGKLKKGATVSYYSDNNGWLQIQYKSKDAYICKDFTKVTSGGTTSVAAEPTSTPAPASTESSAASEDVYNESEAVAFNKSAGFTSKQWQVIQKAVGTTADGKPGPKTARKIRDWQKSHGLPANGKCDDATYAAITGGTSTTTAPSTPATPTATETPATPTPAETPVTPTATETPTTTTAEPTETPSAPSAPTSTEVYNEAEAVAFNKSVNISKAEWQKVQAVVDAGKDGKPGPKTAQAIRNWQEKHGMAGTGKCDEATYAAIMAEYKTLSTAMGGNQTSSLATDSVDFGDKSSSKRTEKISKITIHHTGGVGDAKGYASYHARGGRGASANYYIGNGGEICAGVAENRRAWTSSNGANDQKAITMEVSNSKKENPWPISVEAYKSTIALCRDICSRYGISPHFTGDAGGSLTGHYMFKSTCCPGPTFRSRLESGELENDIKNGITDYEPPTEDPMKVKIKTGEANKFNKNLGLSTETWKAVQQVIRVTADGKPGTQTSLAIARWQKRNGLEITGKLDEATMAAMGIKKE